MYCLSCLLYPSFSHTLLVRPGLLPECALMYASWRHDPCSAALSRLATPRPHLFLHSPGPVGPPSVPQACEIRVHRRPLLLPVAPLILRTPLPLVCLIFCAARSSINSPVPPRAVHPAACPWRVFSAKDDNCSSAGSPPRKWLPPYRRPLATVVHSTAGRETVADAAARHSLLLSAQRLNTVQQPHYCLCPH